MLTGNLEYADQDGTWIPMRPVCYMTKKERGEKPEDPDRVVGYFVGQYNIHQDMDKETKVPKTWIHIPGKAVQNVTQYEEGKTYAPVSMTRSTASWGWDRPSNLSNLLDFWLPPDPWDIERIRKINGKGTGKRARLITKDGLFLTLNMTFGSFCRTYLKSTAREIGSEMIDIPGGYFLCKEDVREARLARMFGDLYLLFVVRKNQDAYPFLPFWNRCTLTDEKTGEEQDVSPVIRLVKDGVRETRRKLDWLEWTYDPKDKVYIGRRKDV